jgi:hypothetical protein
MRVGPVAKLHRRRARWPRGDRGDRSRRLWVTGVGLLAYLGGKALADTVGRYGLYAGVLVVFVVALFVVGGKANRRRMTHRSCTSQAGGNYS